MILRELYYFNKETMEPEEDETYDPQNDVDVIKVDDDRKSRLTLRDINRARRASDNHRDQKAKVRVVQKEKSRKRFD